MAAQGTTIYFHAVDIFTDSDNILGKYSDRLNKSPSLIFIDINGNRELQAVVRALNVVYERFQPRLVVIKSSSFFNYLYQDGSRLLRSDEQRIADDVPKRIRLRATRSILHVKEHLAKGSNSVSSRLKRMPHTHEVYTIADRKDAKSKAYV